jgi:hypothetical protein
MDARADAGAVVGESCGGFTGTSPVGRTGDVVGAAIVVAGPEGSETRGHRTVDEL